MIITRGLMLVETAGHPSGIGAVFGLWDPDRLLALAVLAIPILVLAGIVNLVDLVVRVIRRSRGDDDSEVYQGILDRYLAEMRVDHYENGSPEKVDKATLASMRAMYAMDEVRQKRRVRRKERLEALIRRLWMLPGPCVSRIRRILEWWWRL